ncbi:hypothetical protein THRCLA_06480 [Thraustotheca clavata]|uniref:Uncharacterized protein n=1 Tax=Thraustotheca clavata TaxID=74557 RepID=A0A1V9ZNF4_9STRA|nr:hypothetical protein THRCLA_06480 [Thraustotheca clavata]
MINASTKAILLDIPCYFEPIVVNQVLVLHASLKLCVTEIEYDGDILMKLEIIVQPSQRHDVNGENNNAMESVLKQYMFWPDTIPSTVITREIIDTIRFCPPPKISCTIHPMGPKVCVVLDMYHQPEETSNLIVHDVFVQLLTKTLDGYYQVEQHESHVFPIEISPGESYNFVIFVTFALKTSCITSTKGIIHEAQATYTWSTHSSMTPILQQTKFTLPLMPMPQFYPQIKAFDNITLRWIGVELLVQFLCEPVQAGSSAKCFFTITNASRKPLCLSILAICKAHQAIPLAGLHGDAYFLAVAAQLFPQPQQQKWHIPRVTQHIGEIVPGNKVKVPVQVNVLEPGVISVDNVIFVDQSTCTLYRQTHPWCLISLV